MKITKSRRNNLIFLVIIVLVLIPQTRHPLQILLHKGLSFINQSSLIEKEERANLADAHGNSNKNGKRFAEGDSVADLASAPKGRSKKK